MRTLTVLFIAFVITGNIFAFDTTSVKYFPLKIGNTWIYEYYSPSPPPSGTRYRFKSQITKDTLIGNNKYYFITNSNLFLLYNDSASWFKVDSLSGNLLAYIPGSSCRPGNTQLLDSLPSGLNDLARICTLGPISYRKCYEVGVGSLFNHQIPFKIFNYQIIAGSDSKTYSLNFGISYCHTPETVPFTITLMGCIIGGILHGDTSLVGLKPNSDKIPAVFSLSQNYPNPFNPSTIIDYQLPNSGQVKLVIYDVLGRGIAVLVNEKQTAGTYETEWDGTNYPSGVYFYKLVTADYSETKKMVLIK